MGELRPHLGLRNLCLRRFPQVPDFSSMEDLVNALKAPQTPVSPSGYGNLTALLQAMNPPSQFENRWEPAMDAQRNGTFASYHMSGGGMRPEDRAHFRF